MFLPKIYILPICIHNIILLLWTSTYTDASEDNSLNLKIGFDLPQGENGAAPTLRIRDFDESDENRPRAFDNEAEVIENSNPAVRAASFSNSDETSVTSDNPDNISKDIGRDDPGNSNEDDDYDEGNRIRSTKGLSPGEYEPEDNPKIHESYKGYPASDSEGKRKRRRRDIGKYNKKV